MTNTGIYMLQVATILNFQEFFLGLLTNTVDKPKELVNISRPPYEHLRRILWLCFAHYARNIQKSVVSQEVKDAMFSLHRVIHKDGTEASWQATLSFIEKEGKKAGRDWVQDKIESKFAFPALCWQVAQQIPFKVWQASDDTTNVIEGLHQDQLRDGSSLTLLGGLLCGEQYNDMCLQNLKNFKNHGVSPRYQLNNPSAQAYRMVSRQTNSKKRQFDTADTKIHEHNNKLRRIGNEMQDAHEGVQEAVQKVQTPPQLPKRPDDYPDRHRNPPITNPIKY
ncbi:hypothetical protein F5876DRAFT_84071 [Lentinula aff. lateritia]|uniref:Uncharacterized protein n=1 Tax=Lentinula aff. lateritia TaxID=2804960 RepID=A0ACC1TH47_9AGAR|nr:hypothetical protein F5876DRAFT_84071 [Lentinula aff. lateritia]